MLRRRDLLKAATGVAMFAAVPLGLGCTGPDVDVPDAKDPVFGHGVASGDPLPDAVILWTRVTTKEPAEVRWEMAKDTAFESIVASGTTTAIADRDFTVKVDATGLEAGTTYYYRFIALGLTSPIGRTRTAPLDATRLRFAVVSCASLPHGYFHVYRAIAERPDIDAVLHLGDYIYEYADGDYGKVRTSEPEHAVQTLADYRERYAQYRRDPDLQEAHRQHPFINTWDDHEFADNAFKDGATGDNKDVGPWDARKTAAARAYSEWIPMRDQPDGRVWRAFRYGALAELLFLDTRIWGRDKQVGEHDPSLADPARQILGADQEAWLVDRLRTSTSQWKLVCQQVMMTHVPPSFAGDGWDDYPAARSRFYDVLEQTPVNDVVVLSGDVHSSWACDLARTPEDPTLYDRATGRGSLAVELVTPAITSPAAAGPEPASVVVSKYGWVKYSDMEKRGFILLDVDAQRAHATWLHVESVTNPERAPMTAAAGFATYTGENRLRYEAAAPETIQASALAPLTHAGIARSSR